MKNHAVVAILATLATLAAVDAGAGAYSQPWALAETGNPSPNREERGVAVTQIDGRSARRNDPIAPGKHTVRLHFESARGVFRPEFKELEIEFQPCTRYRFVAHVDTPTGPEWQPRVHTEPIGECRSKFMKGKPAEKPAK